MHFHLSQAAAQLLNDQVNQLLTNGCLPLLGPGVGPIVLGDDLARLCSRPPSGGGAPPSTGASSVGGGAASFQGSAVSILNRVLRQQLDENTDEASQDTPRSSSMKINPFSSLLSGLGHPVSISSPFYAAISGNGTSNTNFVTSSRTRWNGLGFFASGLVESLNRDITTFQDGYRSTIFGFTGGVDYRFNKRLVTGLAFSYSNTHGDFRNGGDFSTNSYGGLLFASYVPIDRTFVQLTGVYARNNYLVARSVTARVIDTSDNSIVANPSGLASSNSNGDVFSLGLLAGYDHRIGRFAVGPRFGVNYSNTRINEHAENGSTGIELKYNDQWIHSLQSIVGIQGSAAFSTSLGILVPQFNADYIHEFANSQRLIHVQFAQDLRGTPAFPGTAPRKFTFQNDVPVRNYANLGTGLVMVFPNGWQSFVHFRAMVGNEQFTNYAGTFGVRIEL